MVHRAILHVSAVYRALRALRLRHAQVPVLEAGACWLSVPDWVLSARGKASFPAQRVHSGVLHRFDLSFCLRPCALSYQVYKKEENAAVECEAKYGNGLDKEATMPAGAGATVPKAPARDFR